MSIPSCIRRSGHLITVRRKTGETVDDMGVMTPVYSIVHLDVQAWVQPANTALQERYARLQLECSHRIYVAEDLGIDPQDLIDFSGRTMRVVGYRDVAGLTRLWYIDTKETAE